MSGSAKDYASDVQGYDARRSLQSDVSLRDYDTRPLQDTMYLAYPQGGYAEDPVQPSPMTYDRQADQMPYPASSFREPRAGYTVTQQSTADSEARKFPEVTGFNPERGPQGSQVYVYISTIYDLAYAPVTISLMFASSLCTPTVDRLEPRGSEFHYQLIAEVPAHVTTGWLTAMVPMTLQVQQNSKAGHDSVPVGIFHYTDGVQSQDHASPHEGSRKRKISIESADSRIPTKRPSHQRLQSTGSSYAGSPYSGQSSLYTYQQRPSSGNYVYGNPRTPYGHERQDDYLRRSTQSGSDRSMYSTSTAPSQQSAWSSPFVGQSAISPALGSTSRFTSLSSTSSSINPNSGSANPPLIRTSTLQPPNSPAGAAAVASSNSMYPYGYKAVLKINGDLDTMADGWSTEEWTAKRRLVQFFRKQNNNTIDAEFRAVPPEQGAPKGGICISCIWWEERQECYVTSVDTIYLLESLVAVRFTVEEKNRIRRNLEGFHPTTVSKGKPDSENFFKVIMDFPNPKPRNIEKDVKVFPWKILAHALKKIIGKYSASYSSTASAIIAPRTATYPALSDMNAAERRNTASPRSTSNSTSSSAYAGSMLSTTMSPPMPHARASEPAYSEASVYPVTAPSLTYSYSVPTTQSQYVSQDQLYPSAGQDPSASLGPRGSWDLASFIDTSPTMPNQAFQRPPTDYKSEMMSPTTTQHSGTHDVR